MADEEIAIIRRVRHEISAEHGHDVDRVVAYYREAQEALKRSGRFRFAASEGLRESSGEPECPAAEKTDARLSRTAG